MDLTIIIVTWNTKDLLLECLDSVYRCIEDLDFRVVVVDNASVDGSAEAVREHFPQAELIVNEENRGFIKANNQVLPSVSSRYVALLNSDTKLIKGAMETLVDFMDQHPRVGMAAPQYLNADGSKQNSFENFPGLASELLNKSLLKILFPQKYPSKRKTYDTPLAVDSVVGACMTVRTEALERVGYMDEDYFFFLDDTDWSHRMWQAGYEVFYVPQAQIYHVGGAATKKKIPIQTWIEYYRSMYIFFRKNKNFCSWLLFRLFRPVKLGINLLATSLFLILTLGTNQRVRDKWRVYFWLCLWHIRLCPNDMGLQKANKTTKVKK